MAKLSDRLQFFKDLSGLPLVEDILKTDALIAAANKRYAQKDVAHDSTWRIAGAVEHYENIAGGLRLRCEDGWIQIRWLSADCVHVRRSQKIDALETYHSPAVEKTDWPEHEFEVIDSDETLDIETGQRHYRIGKHPFRIDVETPEGKFICGDSLGTQRREDGAVRLSMKLAPDEACFGTGERAAALNLRGKQLTIWNAETEEPYQRGDDPLYYNIPFYLGVHNNGVYGVFWDNPARGAVDLGAESPAELVFSAKTGSLSYYLFVSADVNTVLSRYTELTGRIQLPPLWFLGYQQSRWSYYPQDNVLALAKEFRLRGIPCDAIYLDNDYMNGFRVFTWNQVHFPDPEGMIRTLHQQGFKVVPIISPGIKVDPSYESYQSGLKNDVFLKYPDGALVTAAVWPGLCHFPDFLNPRVRDWWSGLCQELLQTGVDGLWNDMCEPAVFYSQVSASLPEYVVHHDEGQGPSHISSHNLYGMQMARASLDALEKSLLPQKRPVNIVRAAYAGTQRYSASWTGDNTSDWDHLRLSISMTLNMGLSGASMTGPDVGGYSGDTNAELFTRWLQAACLLPYCRSHSTRGTNSQEPWAFGQPYEVINRLSIQLRYRFLPYLYSVVAQCAEYGWPIVRPIFMAEPDNPAIRSIDDSYLLGDAVLVAPVLEQGAVSRTVYLPGSTDWYDYWTNERFEGGQTIEVTAPLERLPLFIREGMVLPIWPEMQYAGQHTVEILILRLYPGQHETILYEDDGSSSAYRQGAYRWVYVTSNEEGDIVTLNRRTAGGYDPGYTSINLEVVALDDEPLEVKVDRRGAPLWFYDEGLLEVTAGLFSSVEITRKSRASDRTLLSRPW